MSKSRGSPRKFSEKIALLNRKEAETNAEFEKIIKEVEETTRAPSLQYPSRASSSSSWIDDQRHIDNQLPNLEQFTQYNDNIIAQDISSLHVQHQLAPPPSSNYDQMTIQTPAGVPDIEIFPTNDDNYQQHHHHHQQVSNTNYRNDCSNPISASRSLPDIANLRVSSSYSTMAPSYSDQRIPSEHYDYNNHHHHNNHNHHPNPHHYDTNSNILNGHEDYYSHANNNQHTQATLDTRTCWQMSPADADYTYLEHGSSSWCGLNNETLSTSTMMRSNSYNNIGNFNDQSDSKAQSYYPQQQVFDPSSSQRQEDSRDLVI